MKKQGREKVDSRILVNCLSSAANMSCTLLANTKCCYIFHDKSKPEKLKEFRKF